MYKRNSWRVIRYTVVKYILSTIPNLYIYCTFLGRQYFAIFLYHNPLYIYRTFSLHATLLWLRNNVAGCWLHHLVNTSAVWNVHVLSCSKSSITDCQCFRLAHPVTWSLTAMNPCLSSIETSAGWGADKLNHQTYGYSVLIFQNSSWIRTCTHRCWIPLSMVNTQYAVLHKIRGGIQAE